MWFKGPSYLFSADDTTLTAGDSQGYRIVDFYQFAQLKYQADMHDDDVGPMS